MRPVILFAWIVLGVCLSGTSLACRHAETACDGSTGCCACGHPVPTPAPAPPAPVPVTPYSPRTAPLPPVAEHYIPAPHELPENVSAKVDVGAPAPDELDFPERDGVGRRSFADITADPRFAHAEDYSWLVGRLHFTPGRGTWRLRYASVDETDRYGGSVTLTEVEHRLDGLRDGMLVRVHGEVADPESRDPSPEYRVREIRPID